MQVRVAPIAGEVEVVMDMSLIVDDLLLVMCNRLISWIGSLDSSME